MAFNAIIVGMPRSGTSMTAAIFARAGYHVTEDESVRLRQADEYNPGGYWEAEQLIQANAAAFRAAGFAHDNTWLYEAISLEQAERISELDRMDAHQQLVTEFNRHQPWVWKDPRLCYTLGYWWPLVDQSNTRVLLLKRDPAQIYNSFLRVKWRQPGQQSRQDVYARIEAHMKAAEAAIARYDIPHITVAYNEFADNPDLTARRLSELFDVRLTGRDLGFDKRANNSGVRGRLAIVLDRCADHLPAGLRRGIKYLMPSWLMKFLFPFKDPA